MTEDERLRLECALAIQSFETYWAYYLQSDGNLFSDETQRACRSFIEAYDAVLPSTPEAADSDALNLGARSDAAAIVTHLRDWVEGEADYPYEAAEKSRFLLFAFFTGLKSYLLRLLDVSRPIHSSMTSHEHDFSSRAVRWRGHLPRRLLRGDPADLFKSASATETIVVLADIRRSQDLMTYSRDPGDFSDRMMEFVKVTRVLTERQYGVFDKFTGDGFLVYFNEAVCSAAGEDFVDCFFWFMETYRYFARKHFAEWTAEIRKAPAEPIGVGIGADIGTVNFVDLDGHLVAVGDPIVWSSRLSSVASAGEILVNNLLKSRLEDHPRVSLEPRSGLTKTGEDFLAHEMIIEKTVKSEN